MFLSLIDEETAIKSEYTCGTIIWDMIKSVFESFFYTFYDNCSKSWLMIFVKADMPRNPIFMSTLNEC